MLPNDFVHSRLSSKIELHSKTGAPARPDLKSESRICTRATPHHATDELLCRRRQFHGYLLCLFHLHRRGESRHIRVDDAGFRHRANRSTLRFLKEADAFGALCRVDEKGKVLFEDGIIGTFTLACRASCTA